MALAGMIFGLLGVVATLGAIYVEAGSPVVLGLLVAIAVMFPVSAWKFFDRRVQVRIDGSGIYNEAWPVELLPWTHIERIEVRSDDERKYVCVIPARESDSFDVLCGQMFFHVGDSSVPCAKIDAFHLNVDFYEFSESVLEFYEKVRNT